MKVIVISPESADPREPAVLAEMLDAGLPRYHVRKPAWSALELEQWILFLPEWCRERLILHQHHGLVAKLGLGGVHFPDFSPGSRERERVGTANSGADGRRCHMSTSSHDLSSLTAAIGEFDSVFFGPVFRSISKQDYGPAEYDRVALGTLLAGGRRTEVFALGGITAQNASECRELGFDGVAVLGAIWSSANPVRAFLSITEAVSGLRVTGSGLRVTGYGLRFFPVMCLTQDDLPLTHSEQARQLCAAGAKWIQLRIKNAGPAAWLSVAREVVGICRRAGAICVINDSVEIAEASGAHGVHLGADDLDWTEARRAAPGLIIGGTVNSVDDARRARAAGCLDYVGIGPFRFTATKARLAPVLGSEGIRQVLAELGDLPAWVIGGVTAADVPALRKLGAAGVAVSSALYGGGGVAANFGEFAAIVGRPPVRQAQGPEPVEGLADRRDGTAQAPALQPTNLS